MGLRFRKSIKIAPGVKLNLGRKSISISAGVKGARISVNSKGRVTKSLSIPGTGISYVKTEKLNADSTIEKKAQKNTNINTSQQNEGNGFFSSSNKLFQPSGNTDLLKKIIQIFLYIFIPLVAIGINDNLFFPAILLESIYHMIRIHKAVPAPHHRRISTIITGFVIVLSALGSLPVSSPSVESISLSAEKHTMDINETQALDITVLPENANGSLLFTVANDKILAVEQDDGDIYSLHPLAEGTTEIIATSDEIQSNPITVTIIDQARIAAEKKAEEERIAAEKKAEEERIAAEQKAAEERAAAASQQPQQTNSQTVYITPTGKRYHYSSSCNGGKYIASTLDQALASGLTPCKKCVK